ncbi:hypothetical protein ACIBMX_41280 [Streptomyces phaeochromogenes]|uniref:hypothetical protein n=1 Tax=Streptomyces phaeochromogenes TaxID=1923 RepID=UPI0033DED83C
MTSHDYSLLLFDEMHERFGRRVGWPPSASLVSPFLRIIFETLEPEEAGAFFEKARQAHRREHEVADAGTYQFGFAQYLSFDDSWHGSLPHLAAWEAMKAAHESTRADSPDFETSSQYGRPRASPVGASLNVFRHGAEHSGSSTITAFAGMITTSSFSSACSNLVVA